MKITDTSVVATTYKATKNTCFVIMIHYKFAQIPVPVHDSFRLPINSTPAALLLKPLVVVDPISLFDVSSMFRMTRF